MSYLLFPPGVNRISIGMSWREKLTFDLLLHTAKPADADRLAERYKRSPGELGLPGGESGLQIQKSSDGVRLRRILRERPWSFRDSMMVRKSFLRPKGNSRRPAENEVLRLVRKKYRGKIGKRFGPKLAAGHLQSVGGAG